MCKGKMPVGFRFIRWLASAFCPRMETAGMENLPDQPSIIVGNHCQIYGPLAAELYFPGKRRIWCAGQMMNAGEVQAYAYKDFWSYKPACFQWFYRLLSHLIVPLSVYIFNNAHTIGVYHDARIVSTFKKTVDALKSGANVIIFPEYDADYNHILCDFQTKFVEVARLYYRRMEREISFVPLYVAPKLKKMVLGQSVQFRHNAPAEEEQRRICSYLMETITQIARGLPEHKVVPYRNIPRRLYHSNIE